jgi:hypothetical protein
MNRQFFPIEKRLLDQKHQPMSYPKNRETILALSETVSIGKLIDGNNFDQDKKLPKTNEICQNFEGTLYEFSFKDLLMQSVLTKREIEMKRSITVQEKHFNKLDQFDKNLHIGNIWSIQNWKGSAWTKLGTENMLWKDASSKFVKIFSYQTTTNYTVDQLFPIMLYQCYHNNLSKTLEMNPAASEFVVKKLKKLSNKDLLNRVVENTETVMVEKIFSTSKFNIQWKYNESPNNMGQFTSESAAKRDVMSFDFGIVNSNISLTEILILLTSFDMLKMCIDDSLAIRNIVNILMKVYHPMRDDRNRVYRVYHDMKQQKKPPSNLFISFRFEKFYVNVPLGFSTELNASNGDYIQPSSISMRESFGDENERCRPLRRQTFHDDNNIKGMPPRSQRPSLYKPINSVRRGSRRPQASEKDSPQCEQQRSRKASPHSELRSSLRDSPHNELRSSVKDSPNHQQRSSMRDSPYTKRNNTGNDSKNDRRSSIRDSSSDDTSSVRYSSDQQSLSHDSGPLFPSLSVSSHIYNTAMKKFYVSFEFESFDYHIKNMNQGHTISIRSGRLFFNDYIKPFLLFHHMIYDKKLIASSPPVTSDSHSTETIKDSSIELTSLQFKNCSMNLSPRMKFGATCDLILQQKQAFEKSILLPSTNNDNEWRNKSHNDKNELSESNKNSGTNDSSAINRDSNSHGDNERKTQNSVQSESNNNHGSPAWDHKILSIHINTFIITGDVIYTITPNNCLHTLHIDSNPSLKSATRKNSPLFSNPSLRNQSKNRPPQKRVLNKYIDNFIVLQADEFSIQLDSKLKPNEVLRFLNETDEMNQKHHDKKRRKRKLALKFVKPFGGDLTYCIQKFTW